ncbi:hypothetical protein C8J56DRAFT_1025107 [Mycena floridula]|nr:hypothetical protein C8J56DRAFT_1025107 [Mycena floridula]
MAIFPAELFLEILPWIPSKADLLSFRSTSKQFGSLATRQAFRTIAVDFDKKTALGFIALQSNDLAKHVEKVRFLGGRGSISDFWVHDDEEYEYEYELHPDFACDACDQINDCDSDSGDYIDHECPVLPSSSDRLKERTDALCLAFSGLGKFPALRMLTLDFLSEYRENDWESTDSQGCSLSLLFQRQFLTVIADNSTSLTSLTTLNLHNLIASESRILYEKPSFRQFISIPKHLGISVLWEENELRGEGCCGRCRMESFTGHEHHAPELEQFWDDHLTNDILATVSRSHLVSLNLKSPEPIFMACGAITFPELRKLSLTKVIFDQQGVVENFILRHKSTLKHLTLDTCPIYHAEYDPPPRFWSSIWDKFANELVPRLVSFGASKKVILYAFTKRAWEDGPPAILRMHDGKRFGERFILDEDECRDVIREDKQAFERFCSMVKKLRRNKKVART